MCMQPRVVFELDDECLKRKNMKKVRVKTYNGGNRDANRCTVQLMQDLSANQGRLQHAANMYHRET